MMWDEVCENTVEREGRREGGRKWGRGGRKKRGEMKTQDLELVNALGGRLAPAQRCTRDILLAPPTAAPRGISENPESKLKRGRQALHC